MLPSYLQSSLGFKRFVSEQVFVFLLVMVSHAELPQPSLAILILLFWLRGLYALPSVILALCLLFSGSSALSEPLFAALLFYAFERGVGPHSFTYRSRCLGRFLTIALGSLLFVPLSLWAWTLWGFVSIIPAGLLWNHYAPKDNRRDKPLMYWLAFQSLVYLLGTPSILSLSLDIQWLLFSAHFMVLCISVHLYEIRPKGYESLTLLHPKY